MICAEPVPGPSGVTHATCPAVADDKRFEIAETLASEYGMRAAAMLAQILAGRHRQRLRGT